MESKQVPQNHPHGVGVFVSHTPSKPAEQKLPPLQSQRSKLPPVRKYPVIEQKGYYSELITTAAKPHLQSCTDGPETQQSLLCQAGYESNTPKVTTFRTPSDLHSLVERDKHGPTTQHQQHTDFSTGGYTAKVQLPYHSLPGQHPRKIEIERRRREYLKLDIAQLLTEQGIDSNLLMPRHHSIEEHVTTPENPLPPVSNYLPLEVFDNEEFDCRTPQDWLALGYENGSTDHKPIPAKALLPTTDNIPPEDPKSPNLEYSWQFVGVLDYSQEKGLYLVQKADKNGRVRDANGKPVLNEGQRTIGMFLLSATQYWISRIRLLFSAEDPRLFSQRVQFAQRCRENTEALLLYHLSVDCMPVWSGTSSLNAQSLARVKEHALSTPGLRLKLLQECIVRLEKEINLEYDRTMNRISFDRVVLTNPEDFSHITLPQREPERVPQNGFVSVPTYPFEKNRAAFAFNSLLTKPEVISALSNVRGECNRVAAMSLFHITFTKSLRLEEFELTQSQTHAQVQLFLRDSWVTTLCKGIHTSLRDVGPGWFSLTESRWEVYRMSKLCSLMALVRYSLQDSLRFLVQDSLVSLAQLLLDACHSVLHCPQDLIWGSNLINSPYKPKKNPLFLVDLVLDVTGVHYSTPLENFETSIITLFDKGILSTHNVPQLDKFVMQKMFISGTPLLESVGLWEPAVAELRERVRAALRQAAIPLRAYAREYERYLELHNSDIETFLKAHSQEEQTPQEVKREVVQHLKEKERLDHSFPSSIVIGPFTVSVESVRQSLSKKRRALANAVLDRLALKLRKQVEDACEECKAVSRKLHEKPNSIEELTDQREWMKQISDQLKAHEELLSKAMSDYELIDEFFYTLSNEDFNGKWTAIGWPHKIVTQMEMVSSQHVEDEERFNKIQQADQNNFQERLDSLQMVVAGFSGYTDISRAHEVANEVRRVGKQLKESQTMAQTYNNRDRLFGIPITNYDRLQKLIRDFQPFRDLWTTTSDWLRWHESWHNDPLSIIDPEQLERNVTDAFKTMHKCVKMFKDIPACQEVAADIRGKIDDFRPYIPLIQGLRNPGMRGRHWQLLSDRIHMNVKPKANLTFSRCLELGLQDHVDEIARVAEVAGKEYAIEQALDKMEHEWSTVAFEVLPYKETGTYILKSPDEASQLLDDHIVMTQSMSFSPYKKPFEERISTWESKLRMTQDVLEEWLTCQRSWLYLEPIFSSDDINRQLPVEGKRYQTMERTWRKVMKSVIDLCPDPRLLDSLRDCNKLLELVQKGLSDYLETKRGSFPRFYFLSDDELLEILSQTKDPTAVQPHLRKCFENIARLKFQSDLQITHMYSGEGEEVKLCLPVWPSGNVEDWLREVEKSMKACLRDNIERSLKQPRTEWVLSWPGQVVIAGCQTFWTTEVSNALEQGDLTDRLYPQLQTQLVRGRLSKMQRAVLSALIVIEVHAKDVAAKLVEEGVSSINDFEWISQLRYYWARNDLYIRAVNAEFLYGYEYLGNSGRLVITPLTDRCYLTLTGALHLKFGGAPAGPAGTGKTETTKDLGKALAIQTVVFNCSDQLDFIAMGKFLKGLASSGAWACFDEFNRIDVEVLSVVAQQIATINKAERFVFEGQEIPLVASCAVFITMNPGYAGRTELPDNLKALFRPVAMMVPDYAMIAEISLYSFGFSDAKVLSKKITTTFKLSSEQLSSQDHYDFGMRAVKTVISAAGNLKRENQDMNEELICLRAIRDVNVPKFLQDDLKLFNGIVSDLFPKIREEPIDYGTLEKSIRYITKCIQLYETTVVRHGLMLVGPSGSGKTKVSMTALQGQVSVSGGVYEAVQTYVLNPKSITMGQLYGEFDLLTHEWSDGILSSLIRGGSSSMDEEKKWYMFDGPVDAVWIENMNTVLDDNKKLCLSSGEIIKLTDVQDLAVASPATVSRCGMVYLEPSILGLMPFTECWLRTVPEPLRPYTDQLNSLFIRFLQVTQRSVMYCVFGQGERPLLQEKLDRLKELIEPWFIFSLVWSVGATGDAPSCQRFSAWLRAKMAEEKVELCFPEEGLVYDYQLDDVHWVSWMKSAQNVVITPETSYSDIIVPTPDTVRISFLMDMLCVDQVLCIGPTGTGKTLTMSDKLLKNMPAEYITHFLMFSARTSANQTQDYIDSKLDKRRKGVFGPPLGKYFIFFIDDLNMPILETYGAQPPIELLRQWMDHGGWYDRKQIGTFKHLVDINFACAMGPPGGGRNPITQRFTRHFNFLSFTEMEDASKKKIFSTILGNWMGLRVPLNGPLVDATIRVYATITSQLLPTPAKSHYTFNLRDLSKVFQGILMAEATKIELWYHESCRVFQDRLVSAEDRDWFDKLLQARIEEFGCSFEDAVPCQPVLFGDFMIPGADNKAYQLIEDREKLARVMEEYMDDYNQISTTKMKLVLFMDAIQHVCRISRILRQPLGNALLLGVGGSGRQSLTKLATHMSDYECFQIELAKNYGHTEWREDLKSIMLKAGLQNVQITFLFVDTQIKSESFLEDVNNILNSGDVPNLYAVDEQERILTAMKPVVQDLGQQPTKANLMTAYIKRVRSNIHTVLCMSPIGEVFRARLRQFPSLVTCCTIDWFSAWPEEALQSVAASFLYELPELEAKTESVCLCSSRKCAQYLAELSRYNYVTPKSYLELLAIFSSLIGRKKQELHSARQRMKTGLDKLLRTAEDVSKMQEELEMMRPLLEEAAKDTVITMEKIKETRTAVQAEEAKASQKACVAGAIAEDAQKDLDEALPALDAALTSLKSLNKNDVVEVRAMQRPPHGVKLVIEAVCIMRSIKPKKVAGEKPGTKVDDYWEPGKSLLQDPGKFLEGLFKFDKVYSVIKLVQPYIDNEEFQPANIAKVSKACTSICQWVRAMHVYHFVAKGVEPKRKALQEAQEDLAVTQLILDDANEKLAQVEEGIATLFFPPFQCNFCNALFIYIRHNSVLSVSLQLIGGLADEKVRWRETVQHLEYMVNNVSGDVLLAAGYVAYLGPFTVEYRSSMADEWLRGFKEQGVPHTEEPNLISTLGDKVKIRSWQITGLPKDTLSVENGVITQYSQRWALFIDPQGQANKWVKNMERDNGLDVMKLSDRDFLRSLENAIRFGKPCLLENIGEELDPALEPVLLRQTFKQQGSTVLKLGDAVIPYHDDFKMYITTKLPNPHYSPEISTKDQLLGRVVAEERPDLEEAKNQLIVSNARMKQELKEIEDQILFRLSSSEGNPVDDEELIRVLGASKIKAGEIQAKVMVAEETERDIDATRLEYVPVAVRTQILFFCVSDLSNVDPMYQYSLEWFLSIFMSGIANSERADTVEQRIISINEFFTFSLYSNVCRSLFEKHKLMFAFLLCARIMMNENKIDMSEWRYLLAGGMPQQQLSNPAVRWLSERAWQDILGLSALPTFNSLADSFPKHMKAFKRIFDSSEPNREPVPGEWNTQLDSFQKLLILRCLRADRMTHGLQDFVAAHLGQRFIEPQASDLSVVFKESSPSTPLIFVLSPGTDPAADLYKFADVMKFSKKMSAISLGQGQGPWAEAMMHSAMERGKWVFFQNCHLAPSWMPSMERLIENIDPDKVHRDFRLWLTSLPSNKFPVSILQNGSKMTIEPPRGIKANLLKTYLSLNDDFITTCTRSLLLSLCLFHGNAIERRKFGPLGFNIPYEFTDGDLRICISQLKMFLDEYQDIPYKVLKYTAGEINYGGRVTDDWDRRCILNVLEDFYCPAVINKHWLIPNHQPLISVLLVSQGYLAYIRGLPINDTPEIFGLHDNANISFAQNEAFALLGAVVQLQPKAAASGGKAREEIVEEIVAGIVEKVPQPISVQEVMTKYPVQYEESMNTVLIQEVIRYNRLLVVISQSLSDIVKALKGLVVMSSELELMANSLFINKVPDMWQAKAYPSLKPLASWVSDLLQRIKFLHGWISDGVPPVFWISGFFFPQAFLTGTLQNFARRSVVSIDTIGFDFRSASALKERPEMGCYIHGLFLEGARWDAKVGLLTESRPKELYTEMAVIWMVPEPNRKPPTSGVYICPIYKTLTRAGTLSTTGHSTNYVIAVELPTHTTQRYWIKQGVALICALDY
uniref:Dynein heavy chain 1, axonemal n=1 Tax=Oncorhynchus tshawytscha TaxID=74940 RepID=A0AAZ3Q3C2_ONCTS